MKESLTAVCTCVLIASLSLGAALPAVAANSLKKPPATDNATREDVHRMIGTWRLVKQEPEQRDATRTRAEYIAKGLLLKGTPYDVLIKNLCSIPLVKTIEIKRDAIEIGRKIYRYAPGRGKLIIEHRGDRVDKKFRSVYDKIGPREIAYRFEKDGTLVLETDSLKELGGKSIRYTLTRTEPAPGPASRVLSAPEAGGLSRTEHRLWTSTKGSTLEAKLVSIGDTRVVLKEKDGNERSVPIKALSDDDRIYIKSIALEEDAG